MRNLILTRVLMVFLGILSLNASLAQGRKITGLIADDKGAILSGASVTVKNTRVVTTSNNEGTFSINVPESNNTLVISYVGMASREVKIGSSNTINISLTPNAGSLSDVVVVGYGTAKRANLTSAQTTVTAKDIDRTINTTVEQAIQGRAAGVYITQNLRQPGGGISVNIRGVSSINGNTEPLYVIDGVQVPGQSISFGGQSSSNPLAGLNPADIDDIQVLQGPSATAIYGSRATNGVLLITTKRGKSGDAKFAYGFQYNIQTPPKRLKVMDLQQYAQRPAE